MNAFPISPSILSISLESDGARFLLSRQTARSVLVERAEYCAHAFPSRPGPAAGDFRDLALFLAEKRDAMNARSARVRIALPPDAAFFRVWEFPFRSGRKLRRAVSLLLETELPFQAEAMSLRLCPAGRNGNTRYTLAAILLRAQRDALAGALREQGIIPEMLTVQPFPLLNALPLPGADAPETRTGKKGGEAWLRAAARHLRESLLHGHAESRENRDHEALCLLVQGGTVTLAQTGGGRIRNVLHSGVRWPEEPPGAEQTLGMGKALLREAEILFSNTGSPLRKIIAAGDAEPCAVAACALSRASGLPARRITLEELPFSLAFAPNQSPGGDAAVWPCEWAATLGLAMAGNISFFGRAVSLPASLRRISAKQPDFAPGGTASHPSGLSPAVTGNWGRIGLWLSALALAWVFALWAGAHSLKAEAELVEQRMRESFQRAVPEIQKRFSAGQMLAILKERIAAHGGQGEESAPAFGALDMLRAVHEASSEGVQVALNSFTADRQRVLLSGTAPDFTHVERFRKALSELAEFSEARILSTSAQRQQERVNFEIDCARRLLP